MHARWVEVGHFHDDDGPFYGVDDEDAFAMDEDWDFSEWGDPEPDHGLTSLHMTLHSVIWQLETDETGTAQLGITPKRRAQMTRRKSMTRVARTTRTSRCMRRRRSNINRMMMGPDPCLARNPPPS